MILKDRKQFERYYQDDFLPLLDYELPWKKLDENGNDIDFICDTCKDTETGKDIGTILVQPTDGKKDWLSNFNFFATSTQAFSGSQIWAHKGFYQAWRSAKVELREFAAKYESIYIQGYSRGGAIGQIIYEDLKWHYPEKNIWQTLYEPPKVYKKKSRFFEKDLKTPLNWEQCHLILNHLDPVTWVPPFGFKHFGTLLKISNGNNFFPIKHYPDQVIQQIEKQENLK